MPSSRPTPAIRACRWAWPTSPRCCGATSSSTTRPTRAGANRDRFVLSNGHGSMLLYALLHLTGYAAAARGAQALPPARLADRRAIRSSSRRSGIETTTGPLGQGLANAVGMALAEKHARARSSTGRASRSSTTTPTCSCGDGCLMEGISHEACSLAGTLRLGKLIGFYDDNGISIDGQVQGWFTDDTPKRFEAYGWHVIRDVDGLDAEAIERAIREARRETATALADLLQDDHRLRRAAQAGHQGGARRGARRRGGGGGARGARLAVPAVRGARGDPRGLGRTRSRARAPRQSGSACSPRYRRPIRTLAAEFERRMPRRAAGGLAAEVAHAAIASRRRLAGAHGDAQVLAGRAQWHRPRCCRSCSAARPT